MLIMLRSGSCRFSMYSRGSTGPIQVASGPGGRTDTANLSCSPYHTSNSFSETSTTPLPTTADLMAAVRLVAPPGRGFRYSGGSFTVAQHWAELTSGLEFGDLMDRTVLGPEARHGEPQDIANLAVFLASDLASWITGETYVIDGGAGVRSRA